MTDISYPSLKEHVFFRNGKNTLDKTADMCVRQDCPGAVSLTWSGFPANPAASLKSPLKSASLCFQNRFTLSFCRID